MHLVHLTNYVLYHYVSYVSLRIIHALLCVPFLLGSICKYRISVDENTSSLKQINQINKCALS